MLATIIGSYRKPNYLKIIIKINFILLFIISFNSSLFAKNFLTSYLIFTSMPIAYFPSKTIFST